MYGRHQSVWISLFSANQREASGEVCKKSSRIFNVQKGVRDESNGLTVPTSKITVFLELRSPKTDHFSEQVMSADKYPSIFSRQMEAIVYIISVNKLIGSFIVSTKIMSNNKPLIKYYQKLDG